MIPLYTREAVRAVDRDAVERLRVPSLLLMENAGAGATRVLLALFRGELHAPLVIGGIGQNGGDAWVVARHLINAGFSPRCYLVGDGAKVRGDARVNLDVLQALGLTVETITQDNVHTLGPVCMEASCIVDGLFGTGLDRPLEGLYASAIEAINRAHKPVLALDLPSGIDADTGQVLGVAVHAKATATFAAYKRGLHQYPGVEHAGQVECVSIGVPPPSDLTCALLEARDVAALLVPRAGDAHKGRNGHVLAIAGSAGKTGAALLSATAALRAGAGLVTVATDPEAQRALDQKVVEVMTAALDPQALRASVLALAAGKDAALMGPGLGLDDVKRALARELAIELPIPCVIDADALTSIGRDVSMLRAACAPRVLTPHPGEASRLLGLDTPHIQADRYRAASELAQRSGQVVVLKGARTVVASPEGELRVCAAGTPALGTAGTGDVLSGVIAALCATNTPFEAAWAGVELHARAGVIAAASDRGLLAGEVATALPRALEACRASALS